MGGVEVANAGDLVSADGRVAVGVAAGGGHQGQPLIDAPGGYVLEGEAVGGDVAGDVQAAAFVVEVAPEQHPEVADLEGPLAHDAGGAQARFDRSDSCHQRPPVRAVVSAARRAQQWSGISSRWSARSEQRHLPGWHRLVALQAHGYGTSTGTPATSQWPRR